MSIVMFQAIGPPYFFMGGGGGKGHWSLIFNFEVMRFSVLIICAIFSVLTCQLFFLVGAPGQTTNLIRLAEMPSMLGRGKENGEILLDQLVKLIFSSFRNKNLYNSTMVGAAETNSIKNAKKSIMDFEELIIMMIYLGHVCTKAKLSKAGVQTDLAVRRRTKPKKLDINCKSVPLIVNMQVQINIFSNPCLCV